MCPTHQMKDITEIHIYRLDKLWPKMFSWADDLRLLHLNVGFCPNRGLGSNLNSNILVKVIFCIVNIHKTHDNQLKRRINATWSFKATLSRFMWILF